MFACFVFYLCRTSVFSACLVWRACTSDAVHVLNRVDQARVEGSADRGRTSGLSQAGAHYEARSRRRVEVTWWGV